MDSKRSFRMLGLFALAVLVVVVLFNLANAYLDQGLSERAQPGQLRKLVHAD